MDMLRICDNEENIDMFQYLQVTSSKQSEYVFIISSLFNKAILRYENVVFQHM